MTRDAGLKLAARGNPKIHGAVNGSNLSCIMENLTFKNLKNALTPSETLWQ